MSKAFKCDYCGELVEKDPVKTRIFDIRGGYQVVRASVKFGRHQNSWGLKDGDVCDDCLASIFKNLAGRLELKEPDEPVMIKEIFK